MEHIDERSLDQYILNPEVLDQAEKSRIKEHLEFCNACRRVGDYLRSFHAEMQQVDPVTTDRIDELVNDLFPIPREILLKPFRYSPEPDEPSGRYTGLLAAMTTTETKGRYRTVCTLASEEQQTIARIVQDQQEDLYRLYILTDDPRKQRFAIVSIPSLKAEFVADDRGRVDFRGEYGRIDWNNISGLLLTMVSEHYLSDQQMTRLKSGERLALGNHIVWFDQNMLMVQKHEDGSVSITRVLLTQDEATPILGRFEETIASISLPVIPATLTVRLYS